MMTSTLGHEPFNLASEEIEQEWSSGAQIGIEAAPGDTLDAEDDSFDCSSAGQSRRPRRQIVNEASVDQSAGYVRIYRKLLQNPIWIQLAPAVAKVAIYFLLRANYKATQWYDGTGVVDVPAGSFITSYARTATACNLSVQQIRDAFDHLFGTQFATYRRTKRWTLVSVLNWASYQASTNDQEHTPEHTVEQVRNRKGTTDKELRIKNTTLRAIAPHQPTLERVAHLIYARHPSEHGRRDCGVAYVEKKLSIILKHKRVPAAECESYLLRVDRNHAAMCASDDWRKENGQFAKGLRNYLAPTEERYDIEPAATARKEPARLMA
jgi:hypothetical protein